MKLFTKLMPIPMPESAWKLLGMYVVVMNYYLLQQKSPQVNLSKIVGAVLTQYVVHHERWIREEFYKIRGELWVKPLHRFFNADQLAAIESASASQIPNAVRIGWDDRYGRAA